MVVELFAQHENDSVRRGFYVNIDAGFALDYRSPNIDEKYFDKGLYTVQWAPFEMRTPNVGLGFYSKRKRTFFRADLSYWYGRKDAQTEHHYSSSGINGHVYHQIGPPSSENGVVDYKYSEVSTGKVNLHFLDWNLCLGLNLGKHISFIGGFRKSFLFAHSYTGTLDRNGYKYENHGWYGPPTKLDTAYVHYEGKEMRATEFQKLNGTRFWNTGFAFFYSLGKHRCFSEINVNIPPMFSYDRYYAYIVGKFSIEFSGKTSKPKQWKSKRFEAVKIY